MTTSSHSKKRKINGEGGGSKSLARVSAEAKSVPYSPAAAPRSKLGQKILGLYDLRAAVGRRQSVICPSHWCWSRPRPAAFVINLSGSVIVRLLDAGLFVYVRIPK